jgi:hypothetical protein
VGKRAPFADGAGCESAEDKQDEHTNCFGTVWVLGAATGYSALAMLVRLSIRCSLTIGFTPFLLAKDGRDAVREQTSTCIRPTAIT